MRIPRLPARYMSYRYRSKALSTRESILKKDIWKALPLLMELHKANRKRGIDARRLDREKRLIECLVEELRSLLWVEVPAIIHTRHQPRTIQSFSDSDCWMRFRTRKEDIPRLMTALGFQIGGVAVMSNKSKFTLEEIFLFGVNRLTYPGRLEEMCAIYGRDFSQWSRAFHWFVDFMIDNHDHRLQNYLEFWVPYFPQFSEAVRLKIFEKGGEEYPVGSIRVAAFIDCTVLQTCRPGGGPTEGGILAPRWHPGVQRAVYNGWKKHHGLKYQSVEAPNGMCLHLFGPMGFRHSDLELFDYSDINNEFASAQQNEANQYVMYGDGIYCNCSHTISGGDPIMPKARISNEWDYGVTCKLYSFVKFKYAMKILNNKYIGKYYAVATLLRNAHCCLYDGLTASYYDCPAPSLEEYFQVD